MSKKCVLFVLTMVLVFASSAPAVVGPDGIFPLARYEFEGSYEDTTGNGYDGAAQSGASIYNPIPLMPQWGMLELDPDNDAGVIVSGLTDLDAVTVAMWVNSDVDLDGVKSKGVALNTSGWSVGTLHFNMNYGKLKAHVNGEDPVVGTTLLPVGEWHHIAVTASDDLIAVYYDGVLEGSAVPSDNDLPTVLMSQEPTIGGWQKVLGDPTSIQREWDGLQDDVRIYNTALSAAQVRQLVPEPMTLSLLGLGGLALVRRRRK